MKIKSVKSFSCNCADNCFERSINQQSKANGQMLAKLLPDEALVTAKSANANFWHSKSKQCSTTLLIEMIINIFTKNLGSSLHSFYLLLIYKRITKSSQT
jgi:hypothetical protein